MKIDDYIINGKVARNRIAIDIKRRNIGRSEIEQLVSDNRIQSVFLNDTFNKKVPKKEWNQAYLDVLTNVAIAECFNRDYLLYLDEVADFVTKARIKKIRLGAVVIVLVIIAGVVVLIYKEKTDSKTSLPKAACITETNLVSDKIKGNKSNKNLLETKEMEEVLYGDGEENPNGGYSA